MSLYSAPRSCLTRLSLLLMVLTVSPEVLSDGVSIDKVYHPYVQLLEHEFEYRTLYQQDSDDEINGGQRHIFGYGRSLSDQLFAELYLVATDSHGNDMEVKAYEAELKWQLTEQGEYDSDWGLLFEVEKEKDESIWEANTTLIALHEWADWILTGNFSVIYEWGSDIDNEWETAASSQLRFRNNQRFEPAIEVYLSQDTQGIGPVMTGMVRMGATKGIAKKIRWEFGVILGTDSDTADASWKLNLEYEF